MGGMNEPTKKFLDLVRDALRVRHYAFRTEQAYMFWIRRYILFHGKRHPAPWGERGETGVYDGKAEPLCAKALRANS